VSTEANVHSALLLELPPAWVDAVAARAVQLLLERQEADRVDAGFLDVAGAAEFLACPASRIYSLVSARRLPHHRDGTRLLFDRTELRSYVIEGGAKRP
jgi:excisionase family DNA binding protein